MQVYLNLIPLTVYTNRLYIYIDVYDNSVRKPLNIEFS